jgi:hypothetical protein
MKELTAILAALGAADAAQGLKLATEATSLRTKVRAATNTTDDEAALGTLAAWQRDAAAAADLRAQLEAERKTAAARERAELLAAAVDSMRLTPAEAAADGQPDAFVTGMSNTALRAFAADKFGMNGLPRFSINDPVASGLGASAAKSKLPFTDVDPAQVVTVNEARGMNGLPEMSGGDVTIAEFHADKQADRDEDAAAAAKDDDEETDDGDDEDDTDDGPGDGDS